VEKHPILGCAWGAGGERDKLESILAFRLRLDIGPKAGNFGVHMFLNGIFSSFSEKRSWRLLTLFNPRLPLSFRIYWEEWL
jgi:hypothetical protein